MLLLGLARTRRILHVETLARNVAGCATPDTDGAVPARSTLVEGAPATHRATWPAAAVLAALRGAGHAAALSEDAGSYVCNAALFHALREGLAPLVGFLHVPPIRHETGPTAGMLEDAARLVVGVLAEVEPIRPRARAGEPPSPGRTR